MGVTPEETLAHLARLERRRRAASDAHAAALTSRLPSAAALLRRHGATRVRLFGSLATGDTHPDSDVDLAVEGLPPERYFPALADLMTLFCGPVDLVVLEDAPESLRERVEAEGREL